MERQESRGYKMGRRGDLKGQGEGWEGSFYPEQGGESPVDFREREE